MARFFPQNSRLPCFALPRSHSVGLVLVVVFTLAPCVAFSAPSMAWIFPPGGQRGTTVTLTVAGDNLTDVGGVFATGEGLKAEALPPTTPLSPPLAEVKPGTKPVAPEAKKYRQFRVAIAPDAPLGRQEIRVYDKSGASNPRYFLVGDQPEIVEREPNDESAGQPVETPVVVNGRIQKDTDQDIYSFHGKKGQRIVGEIQGMRALGMINDSWLKGYLELRDGSGKVLAANEGYYHWDPMIAFTLPADGDYSFLFRDLMFRGADSAVYRLAIGSLPRATALFPAGGRRGTTVAATFIGENLSGDARRSIAIPPDAPLTPRDERLQTPAGWTNGLPFAVGDLPEVVEREPNDRREQAMPITPPVTINGRLDHPGDVDSYRLKVTKGQRLVMEVLASRAESPMDSFLRLWDADGNVVEENDDARDRDSRLERTFDSDDTLVLQVRDLDERGGDSFVYRLSIAPPRPDFTLTATPDKPMIGTGGTAALDIKVDRVDGFEGEVTVNVADLPPGLVASQAVIRKRQERGRLTVTAAEGMPIQVMALHVVGKATIAGHEEQRRAGTEETYNIQGTAFTRDLIGPIATVGAPAPVRLAVEPPSLSLKGGDSAILTVRAKRRPEAKSDITVKLSDLPKGVSAEPVTLPATGGEARLTLKADPDAPAAVLDLVATGETKVGDTGITATTPIFSLTVVEAPGFSVALEPKELSAPRGNKEEHSFTVKVERRGGFDGPIDLLWVLPSVKLTLPAGRMAAGQSETKVGFKLPTELAEGAAEAHLSARASIGAEARARDVDLKLEVTAPAGAK